MSTPSDLFPLGAFDHKAKILNGPCLGLGCSLIPGARWLCRLFLGSRRCLLARVGLMRTRFAEGRNY
jgi:hypothetical protein